MVFWTPPAWVNIRIIKWLEAELNYFFKLKALRFNIFEARWLSIVTFAPGKIESWKIFDKEWLNAEPGIVLVPGR